MPLVKLENVEIKYDLPDQIYFKVEMTCPDDDFWKQHMEYREAIVTDDVKALEEFYERCDPIDLKKALVQEEDGNFRWCPPEDREDPFAEGLLRATYIVDKDLPIYRDFDNPEIVRFEQYARKNPVTSLIAGELYASNDEMDGHYIIQLLKTLNGFWGP